MSIKRAIQVATGTIWAISIASMLIGCAQSDGIELPDFYGMAVENGAQAGSAGTDTGGMQSDTGGTPSGAGGSPSGMGGSTSETGGSISGPGGSLPGAAGAPLGAGGMVPSAGGILPGAGGAPPGAAGSVPPGSGVPSANGGGSGGVIVTPSAGGMPAATGGSGPVAPPTDLAGMVNGFACPGGNIGPGTNTLMVRGRQRTFVADFPSDPTRRMGILFSWHGYNQAEGQHRTASNLQPDGDPALPVVVITPDDLDFELPVGLDWQLDEGSVDKNVDLQFFEAMVGCLNQQYDVDPARIHSLGYSAGSVMTALIHSVYPRLVRSVICISGMWFNDQKEIDAIIFAGVVLKPTWPALRPEDGGTILLTHGGLTDIAAVIINLETMAQNAFPFLAQGGRVVVDCAHNNGHTGSPDVGPSVISRFISTNPSDSPSPYLSGGYSGFASSCKLRLP